LLSWRFTTFSQAHLSRNRDVALEIAWKNLMIIRWNILRQMARTRVTGPDGRAQYYNRIGGEQQRLAHYMECEHEGTRYKAAW
jgi:hypothetical protein